MATPTLPTLLRFIKAAGVEKIEVFDLKNTSIKHVLPVKNQADLLYYSGHGYISDPQRRGKLDCWDNGGNFSVDDIVVHINWREDLEYFIIAGCSVLAPYILTDPQSGQFVDERPEPEAQKTSPGPGLDWARKTLRNPNLNGVGPLKGLCGFWDAAPADAEEKGGQILPVGPGVRIARLFAQLVNSGKPPNHTKTGNIILNAWLEATRANNARGIAYDRNSYRYVRTGFWDKVIKVPSW